MSLWVAVYRIKRQPFLTLTDFHVANYHEIKENVLEELSGVDELADFPNFGELRRYISRESGEDKETYYERGLAVLPKLKERYRHYQPIETVLPDERDYLESHDVYEELYFVKRCYALEKTLKDEFKEQFLKSEGLPIVLDAASLERFCQLAEQEIPYEEGYIYKLVAG